MPTLNVPRNGELHRKLVARITSRIKASKTEQQKHHPRWKDAEERMTAYVPESTADAKRRTKRESGTPEYTTIQIPYTYALVMTAHTYWTSVFFSRSPIHQFVGRHGAGEMQVQALESLIQYQVDAGEMLAPYYLWMYDAAKYGVGIISSYWDQKTISYGEMILDESGKYIQNSRDVAGYTGNCVYNVSPYDFFHDPRVTIGNFQKGEFCHRLVRMAWHEILAKQDSKDYMNIEHLTRSSRFGGMSGDSNVNDSAEVERPQDDFEIDDGDAKHPSRARFYEFYCRIIPQEWGLGPSKKAEVWVFTITADLSVLVGVTPHGAWHGMFPFDIFEPELEAYGVYNRGIPEMCAPLQFTMDWLLNSHMYNVRAALNNQFIVDPSRLIMKDLQSGSAGFVFRMKPEAYGQDVRTMFSQVPVQDVTAPHMKDIDGIFSMGERTFGINEQMFGMLQKSGSDRKTATEIRSATGFGVNRQKTQTEWLSAAGFAPHAKKLVNTSQQYYDGAAKFRIVGDAALLAGPAFVSVTPEDIAGQYDYVSVDGTLPIDRTATVKMWQEMLSGLGTTPMGLEVLNSFDMTKLMGWIFTLAGLKNVNQFKVQVMPPGAGPSPGMVPGGPPGAGAGALPPPPPPGPGGPPGLPPMQAPPPGANGAVAPPLQ